MRQAVVDALKGDQRVAALVGDRVYVGIGPMGGISRQLTPEAFTQPDGELLPSIVVKLGPCVAVEGRPMGPDALPATQFIELWVYHHTDYRVIYEVIRAAKAVLAVNASLRPVEDPVAWAQTRWDSEPFGEQIDPNLTPPAPVVMSRYAATVRELLPT